MKGSFHKYCMKSSQIGRNPDSADVTIKMCDAERSIGFIVLFYDFCVFIRGVVNDYVRTHQGDLNSIIKENLHTSFRSRLSEKEKEKKKETQGLQVVIDLI